MNRSTLTDTLGSLAAVASVGVALGLAVFGRPEAPEPIILPPCIAEDGGPIPCVWDGPNRGNRQGDRIVITERS